METIIAIAGVLFAALLALLGLEKRKGKKKDKVIEQQRQQLVHHAKQNDVLEAASETAAQAHAQQSASEEEQAKEEEAIQDAQTDEEIIEAGNDIIDGWNAGRLPDGTSAD